MPELHNITFLIVSKTCFTKPLTASVSGNSSTTAFLLFPIYLFILLENKNILITGAARGIGLEFARMGLSSGARVIMSDVDMETGRIEEQKLQVETAQH